MFRVPFKTTIVKSDNSPSGLELYNLIRDQIKHEDNLINNRVTWLLTLQGFLFSAYGFSLSAQATIAASFKYHEDKIDNYNGLLIPIFGLKIDQNIFSRESMFSVIYDARTLIACMALTASLVLLFGAGAAALSILNLLSYWEKQSDQVKRQFPPAAGTGIKYLGAYAGLLPTYFLPITTAVAWYWLVPNGITIFFFVAVLLVSIGGILLAVYIKRDLILPIILKCKFHLVEFYMSRHFVILCLSVSYILILISHFGNSHGHF